MIEKLERATSGQIHLRISVKVHGNEQCMQSYVIKIP